MALHMLSNNAITLPGARVFLCLLASLKELDAMSHKLQFEHRQLTEDWTNSPAGMTATLLMPAQKAETFAQEILDTAGNMSLDNPPNERDVDSLIHKAATIRDDMLDLQEIIEKLPLIKGGAS